MRQQVEIVAAVHFDAPAELSRSDLTLALADALLKGTHATAEPQRVRVLSLREEAALFNNNGDQWTRERLRLSLGGVEQFQITRLGWTDDEAERASSPGWDRDGSGRLEKCADDIAEALNMWQARGDQAPPARPPYDGATPVCAGCGNDGSKDGLYLSIDARWNPAAKVWKLEARDDAGGGVFDCLECDHQTPAFSDDALFPYGVEVRPDDVNGLSDMENELLAPLKQLVANWDANMGPDPFGPDMPPRNNAIEQARAAIHKAEVRRAVALWGPRK